MRAQVGCNSGEAQISQSYATTHPHRLQKHDHAVLQTRTIPATHQHDVNSISSSIHDAAAQLPLEKTTPLGKTTAMPPPPHPAAASLGCFARGSQEPYLYGQTWPRYGLWVVKYAVKHKDIQGQHISMLPCISTPRCIPHQAPTCKHDPRTIRASLRTIANPHRAPNQPPAHLSLRALCQLSNALGRAYVRHPTLFGPMERQLLVDALDAISYSVYLQHLSKTPLSGAAKRQCTASNMCQLLEVCIVLFAVNHCAVHGKHGHCRMQQDRHTLHTPTTPSPHPPRSLHTTIRVLPRPHTNQAASFSMQWPLCLCPTSPPCLHGRWSASSSSLPPANTTHCKGPLLLPCSSTC